MRRLQLLGQFIAIRTRKESFATIKLVAPPLEQDPRALAGSNIPTKQSVLPTICTMTRALFVVDVQNWGFSGDWALPNHESLLERISERLAKARNDGELIVHIQNDGDEGELDAPGEHFWQLVLEPLPGELVVRKTTQDTFESNPELAPDLIKSSVHEVELIGAQSELCVLQTAKGARAAGFSVFSSRQLHGTYDGGYPGSKTGPSNVELSDLVQQQIENLN